MVGRLIFAFRVKNNNRKLWGIDDGEGGEGIGPSALKPFVLEFFPQYKSSGWEV